MHLATNKAANSIPAREIWMFWPQLIIAGRVADVSERT